MPDKKLSTDLTFPKGLSGYYVLTRESHDVYVFDIALSDDITATLEVPCEAYEEVKGLLDQGE
jgi:hypothetical protein